MANYYEKISTDYEKISTGIKNITPEEAEWIETVLSNDIMDAQDFTDPHQLRALREDVLDKDEDPDNLLCEGSWPGFEWEIQTDFLWIYAEENLSLTALGRFVTAFLRKFRPDGIFAASFSYGCSKPQLDSFGGGWIVATAREVRYGGTQEDIRREVERIGEKA